jgi:hypothetical protein
VIATVSFTKMSYNVYLTEFEQRWRRDHHAIFVARTTNDDQSVGTLCHVIGNPGLGMDHQVKRGYKLGRSKNVLRKFKIATLPASNIREFENLVLTVPAPHDPDSLFGYPPTKDCQHWAANFIAAAINAGLITKTEE